MNKIQKFFNISTFNVRGLSKEVNQEQLDDDMLRFGIYIICIQETKIKDGIDINLKDSWLLTFPTKNLSRGIGFLIHKSWTDSVHRVWQESERICVLQLKTRDNKIISVVNVYGPTSQITKDKPESRDTFFNSLEKVLKNKCGKQIHMYFDRRGF